MTSRTFVRGAIFEGDGSLRYIHDTVSEPDTWMVALGWPDQEEIDAHKRRGTRFALVAVTEVSVESGAA